MSTALREGGMKGGRGIRENVGMWTLVEAPLQAWHSHTVGRRPHAVPGTVQRGLAAGRLKPTAAELLRTD